MQKVSKYWLDKNNIITNTNEYWNTFALENYGHKVLRPHVVGKPLFQFIKDDVTRMLMEAFISNARISNKELSRHYRCDSPQVKRFMEMRVIPEGNGVVRVENEVLREEPLEETRNFVTRGVGTPFLKRCSVCNRLNDGNQWLEPDSSQMDHHFIGTSQTAFIAYTVCQDCKDETRKRLERFTA